MSISTFFLIWGLYFSPTHPIQLSNGETARALEDLRNSLISLLQRSTYPGPSPTTRALAPALDSLQQALTRDAAIRVNRTGSRSIDLEAKSRSLFTTPPILPPENKKNGNWTFETHRFEVKSGHLFIFALTFKGGRTIRLRKVTLYFQDGSQVVHDTWAQMEGGNGKAFPKRVYLPELTAYGKNEPRSARALAAVAITGSAQDGGFSAALDFLFEVPDADEAPYRKPLSLVAKWKKGWNLENPNVENLRRYLEDVHVLEGMLGIEMMPGKHPEP